MDMDDAASTIDRAFFFCDQFFILFYSYVYASKIEHKNLFPHTYLYIYTETYDWQLR